MGETMTTEEEILKELKWHTKLIEAEFALLADIKFELINARIQPATYTIPVPKKSFMQWLRERLG